MRYAIFTDIHANLEALEAVLAKIDELSKEKPIDRLWFLGDLVGYGPNPNECIDILRARTDVIIAGNHDWAAVGKLDLEDFSAAARISAEWTAEHLTEEHREFLRNLPERLEIEGCTLVHGSPYGPLWEYLTSEILAERSFQYFNTRFCIVGHTHVPVIFQQDSVANEPTRHLGDSDAGANEDFAANAWADEETAEMAAVVLTSQKVNTVEHAHLEVESNQLTHEEEPAAQANDDVPTSILELPETGAMEAAVVDEQDEQDDLEEEETAELPPPVMLADEDAEAEEEAPLEDEEADLEDEDLEDEEDEEALVRFVGEDESSQEEEEMNGAFAAYDIIDRSTTPENDIQNADERLNTEIEELLELLGLSQSMVKVTNEMLRPPEGRWEPPHGYRAIINPGGVGQPRDGDARAAFMIFDSEQCTFDFYRIDYSFEKTQEKIIEAGLPQYLAVRLAYGR